MTLELLKMWSPTGQIAPLGNADLSIRANYPYDYIGAIDDALRFYRAQLIIYFILLGVLWFIIGFKTDPLKAFFGALAFGFSTYLIIIIGVGHNSKAHAIAYMPLVIAGFILVLGENMFSGLLTMFATALEINANHFQMTYYLLIFLLILSVILFIVILKIKHTNHF
jgi:hypothetical protein